MKKGYVCQKDYIIKNLTYLYFKNYPNNCIFIFSLITKIMEDIEIYDKSSQILFSESLGELAKKFSENNKDFNKDQSKELTIILKHFMIAISTLEKSISDEYVIQFNNLIETFCNNKFKIILDKELKEYAISLGKFGQIAQNKKFSVFFCVSLIRISKIRDEELYDKIMFLAEDTERVVKFEMAYHIRFIIYLNDSKFCQEKITNILNYYLEDCDINFLDIIIESILYSNNLLKFNEQKSFKEQLKNKIEEIICSTDFSTLSYDFHIISHIFLCLLNFSYDNGKGNKHLHLIIKQYLKNYFYVTELQLSTNIIVKFKIDYILKVFDKILYIFSREKDIQFLNEIFPIAMKYYFQKKENTDIFYEILHLIILKIPNEFLNKNFFNTFLFFLEEDNYDSNSPSYNNTITLPEINTTSNSIKDNNSLILFSQINKKEYKEFWFNNFDIIMQRMIEIENEKFFSYFFGRFNSFLDIIKKCKEWRIGLKLFKSLQMIPKYIMFNHVKYTNYEDYFKILFNFCKELLKKSRNILIENEITLLLCQIIHFSKSRNKILDYLKENFLLNKSFYRRRIYCLFGDSAYLVFSKEFIKEKNIYSNLFQNILIKDIPLMQSYIINIITKYELYDNDILNIVKNILNTSSKNDILLNTSINNYLKLSLNKTQKNNNNNEKEKIEIENKVCEIEKIQKEKEKKSDNSIKKSIKPKHKNSANGFSSSKKNKLSSKFFQKIEDKNLFYNTTKNQNNKFSENFYNEHNMTCNNHFPTIRKTSSNCCFNSINKTSKYSSHKKI